MFTCVVFMYIQSVFFVFFCNADLPMQLVFSTDQTYTLSHLIQELASSPPKADPGQCTHEGTVLIDKERIQLLRLAVSRNLCRAMLEESI